MSLGVFDTEWEHEEIHKETAMTREQHMEWCKGRALEYLDKGDVANAIASMLSDLAKHPETRLSSNSPLPMLGMMTAARGDSRGARRFIEGFN